MILLCRISISKEGRAMDVRLLDHRTIKLSSSRNRSWRTSPPGRTTEATDVERVELTPLIESSTTRWIYTVEFVLEDRVAT